MFPVFHETYFWRATQTEVLMVWHVAENLQNVTSLNVCGLAVLARLATSLRRSILSFLWVPNFRSVVETAADKACVWELIARVLCKGSLLSYLALLACKTAEVGYSPV